MKNWMKKLAVHYENTRRAHPKRKLVILFDIDGTILDMRHMILHVLKAYDDINGTRFFDTLKLRDISVHENQVAKLLKKLMIPEDNSEEILKWYSNYRWSTEAVLTSHRPFLGVMEVIRWFQMQPNTFIALNTGRPEILRSATLRSLNKLGYEYKVRFTDDFLYMNPNGWEVKVAEGKARAVSRLRKAGYHIIAMVDNEPENLKSVSEVDPEGEILLLHANTIFESKRKRLPAGSVSGKVYDLTELIEERALPRHIQFVWHGVNDEGNLRQFLSSTIQWAECDVRLEPTGKEIVLRHDSFDETLLADEEELYHLRNILGAIKASAKSIKLDLKENGPVLEETLNLVKQNHFDDSRLWFNAKIRDLGERGFTKLSKEHPLAIIQCPIDDLAPMILREPARGKEIVDRLKRWGINRFSVNWRTPHLRRVLDQMDRFGLEPNIYNVPDLESFLKAVLLMPRSITADFNFPKWHYYGRGSGEKNRHYEYAITKVSVGA